MLDQDEGHAALGRHPCEERPEGVEPAGGGAEADNQWGSTALRHFGGAGFRAAAGRPRHPCGYRLAAGVIGRLVPFPSRATHSCQSAAANQFFTPVPCRGRLSPSSVPRREGRARREKKFRAFRRYPATQIFRPASRRGRFSQSSSSAQPPAARTPKAFRPNAPLSNHAAFSFRASVARLRLASCSRVALLKKVGKIFLGRSYFGELYRSRAHAWYVCAAERVLTAADAEPTEAAASRARGHRTRSELSIAAIFGVQLPTVSARPGARSAWDPYRPYRTADGRKKDDGRGAAAQCVHSACSLFDSGQRRGVATDQGWDRRCQNRSDSPRSGTVRGQSRSRSIRYQRSASQHRPARLGVMFPARFDRGWHY
jgi:hypothetical protein